MARYIRFRILFAFTILLIGTQPAAADSVQLANGEVLKGKVLALDDKQITLESESLGKLSIPRAKVATITLGDKPPVAVVAPKVDPTTPVLSKTAEDVLKQLKAKGANPKDLSELQKAFPELSSPEASKIFNDTLQGLATGKKSIQDVRNDAIKARDELKKLTEDQGPDVEAATNPYLNILEKFIRETTPKEEKKTSPAKK